MHDSILHTDSNVWQRVAYREQFMTVNGILTTPYDSIWYIDNNLTAYDSIWYIDSDMAIFDRFLMWQLDWPTLLFADFANRLVIVCD